MKKAKIALSATAEKGKESAKNIDLSKLNITADSEESGYEMMARYGLNPNVLALSTITMFQVTMPKERVSGDAVYAHLSAQAAKVQEGDFSRPEEMLSAHAHTLDALFHHLCSRANTNLNAGYLGNAETYLRMALKAQSQCRTTIEALGELKFPKSATFIRQQNIANQQQVNNGQPDGANPPARAREKDITPTNELLEASSGERLDTGAAKTASRVNSSVETVESGNGTKNSGRQRKSGKQRL